MNKKLFKGALVLFASILMAVSCSSNSNPNDNNDSNSNNNNNNTEQKKNFGTITPSTGAKKDGTDLSFSVAAANTAPEGIALTLTFDPANPEGVTLTYAIKSVEQEGSASGNQVENVLKPEHFSYNGSKLSLTTDGAKEITKLDSNGKYNVAKVTITVKSEGYNDKDFVVYTKVAKTH